jgi:adenylate cyclase
MVKIIKQNKGTIDKFMGDEIIALFGAPLEMDDHAFWACKAALEMQEKLSFLQKKWQRERKDIFEIGIGINSGIMTVGNLGSDQIFDFTAIGDNMNIGARLENLTRTYPTKHNIIISEMTVNSTKNKIVVKFIEEVNVKGKLSKIKIFELLDLN